MIVLAGADLVLPDRILRQGTLVLDGGRIVEVGAGAAPLPAGYSLQRHTILPGFIDVHVHGVDGVDSLDEGDPVSAMAAHTERHCSSWVSSSSWRPGTPPV